VYILRQLLRRRQLLWRLPGQCRHQDRPGGYEIDYDYCKGCGICAAECPCAAIALVPEET
jgi:Pyruvate/2-oxoacid:ferredoxin oxidoreductase delta subunit